MLKRANDKIKETLIINGVIVCVEWPKGSVRQWPGSPTRIPMSVAYGYVSRTDSEDGEEIDVYVGDNLESKLVVELEQLSLDTGEHDEYKYMLGYNSLEEAIASYEQHMDFNKVGEVKEMSWEEFEKLLPQSSFVKESSMIRIGDLVKIQGKDNKDYIGRVKSIIANTLAKVKLVAGEANFNLESLIPIRVKFATMEQEETYLEKQIEQLKEDKKGADDELDKDAIDQRTEEMEDELRKVQEKQAMDPSFFGGLKKADQSKSNQEKEMEKGTDETKRSPASEEVADEADDLLTREYRRQGFPGEGVEREIKLASDWKATINSNCEECGKYGPVDKNDICKTCYKSVLGVEKKADANITMGQPPKDMEGMEHVSAQVDLKQGDMVIVEGHDGNGIIQEVKYSPGVESTGEPGCNMYDVLLIDENNMPMDVIECTEDQLEFAGSNVEKTGEVRDMDSYIKDCRKYGMSPNQIANEIAEDEGIEVDQAIAMVYKVLNANKKTAQVTVSETWSPDGTISRDIKFDEVNPTEAEALMSLINHAPKEAEDNPFVDEAMQSPQDQGIDEGISKTKSENAQGDQENPPFNGPAMPGQLTGSKKAEETRMWCQGCKQPKEATKHDDKWLCKDCLKEVGKTAGEGTKGFDLPSEEDTEKKKDKEHGLESIYEKASY